MSTQTKKPKLNLSEENGNAFSIIARARRALKESGATNEQIEQFTTEANSGDYDNVLQTCMKYCDVT